MDLRGNGVTDKLVRSTLRYGLLMDLSNLDRRDTIIPVFSKDFIEGYRTLDQHLRLAALSKIYTYRVWIDDTARVGGPILDGRFLIELDRGSDWVEYDLVGFSDIPVKAMRKFIKTNFGKYRISNTGAKSSMFDDKISRIAKIETSDLCYMQLMGTKITAEDMLIFS